MFGWEIDVGNLLGELHFETDPSSQENMVVNWSTDEPQSIMLLACLAFDSPGFKAQGALSGIVTVNFPQLPQNGNTLE